MPHMLPVAAGQIRDPVSFFVLMVADYLLLHPFPLITARRTFT